MTDREHNGPNEREERERERDHHCPLPSFYLILNTAKYLYLSKLLNGEPEFYFFSCFNLFHPKKTKGVGSKISRGAREKDEK